MRAKQIVAGFVSAVALAAASGAAQAAADIRIFNGNAPGVGFNDPTPAAPVGGNPGLTVGQQRVNAFLYAASIWGAELDSAVPINVLATMTPLTCTATGAVLGSAGSTARGRDFGAGMLPDHLYPVALLNKRLGVDLFGPVPTAHIVANFNSRLGEPDCLAGSPFYLGLDGNAGTQIDLVAVLLHEFAHGLGFATTTNGQTGNYAVVGGRGSPGIYDSFAFDNGTGKYWNQMTAAERAASGLNGRNLVWTGANVAAAAPSVLWKGSLKLVVNAPASIAGEYQVGGATFGQFPDFPGTLRQVAYAPDQANGTSLACAPLSEANAKVVKNRIALVDRGTCGFAVKAKNVQDAGAVGMLLAENVAASPPAALTGVDASVTIPSARISMADAARIKGAMNATSSDRASGVVVRFGVNRNQLEGADALGRVSLFAPNPYQPGSSISHWDTNALPNLLMEPNINAELKHSVKPPYDLTLPMLKDIGW